MTGAGRLDPAVALELVEAHASFLPTVDLVVDVLSADGVPARWTIAYVREALDRAVRIEWLRPAPELHVASGYDLVVELDSGRGGHQVFLVSVPRNHQATRAVLARQAA